MALAHLSNATDLADTARASRDIPAVFRDIGLWVFDLDNTLYPAECNLFAQIDLRMSGFIQELLKVDPAEARRIQKELYHDYGTTLSGLMARHGVKPIEFMDFVHDIDLSPLLHMPELAAAISRLPGRKFIFTNGSRTHAERVAEKLGVLQEFDGIFDIEAGGYIPKPNAEAFQRFLRFCGEAGDTGAMFEDLPHNLEAARAAGLTTVLVRSTHSDHPSQRALDKADGLPGYIDFETRDLTRFLTAIAPSQGR